MSRSARNASTLALIVVGLAAGCGSDTTGPVCGAGTVAVGSTCVPDPDALTCGAGTVLENGSCVFTEDVGTDGSGEADVEDTGPAVGEDVPVEEDTEADTVCVPACDGRVCGDDGCGGVCGDCTDPAAPMCDEQTGQCVAGCVPDCVFAECGDDGCGGTCGDCTAPEKPICQTSLRMCVESCIAFCDQKDCGDDGCGGTCGQCGDGSSCSPLSRCVPEAWECDDDWFHASDSCDCDCGVRDPDCDDETAYVAGCSTFESCSAEGQCVSKAPASWTCSPLSYDAFDACDCGCGAVDPDCGDSDLPVYNCGPGETCGSTGTCEACVPDCNGKQCGGDGCGGSCGTCDDPAAATCFEGACVDFCDPEPILCQYAECGDDGCGGTCGTCPADQTCELGECITTPLEESPTSCVNNCGGVALSGCYCVPDCVEYGDCCEDYAAICGACEPACEGKSCGDDGCGGFCGTCEDPTPYCGADQQCTAECTPQCTGKSCGDDGCGGTCGDCGPDATCSPLAKCRPNDWICPTAYFEDGELCDCGCGAVDPDCASPDALVFGCPAQDTVCGPGGVCDVAFCESAASCGGQWCIGQYAAGGGRYAGVCDSPDPSGKVPGDFCDVGEECATGLCLDGRCRLWCTEDSQCFSFERCVGLPVESLIGADIVGFAGVCDAVEGSGTVCAAQADCKAPGERCQAFVDRATFGPRFLCAKGPVATGQSCATAACDPGQVCVNVGGDKRCESPCPGGDADCTGGAVCGETTFNNYGTSNPEDDPMVPACLP